MTDSEAFFVCIVCTIAERMIFLKNQKTVRLVTSAMMIALSTVLSMITLLKMPLGGSLTPLSMLPVCLISMKYGVAWGIGTSFAYSLIQLLLDLGAVLSWGLTPQTVAACIFCDCLLAFTVLGPAGIFANQGCFGKCAGVALAVLLRFLCHVVSGGTIFAVWSGWENAWLYSVCYNGAFMLPEGILTVIGTYLLLKIPTTQKLFSSAS